MLQVAAFRLPDQEREANEFLKSHKPVDNGTYNNQGYAAFYYDDGEITPEYEIATWREYLVKALNNRQDLEIALHVMEADRAEMNPTRNKGVYDEVSSAIIKTKKAIDNLDLKVDFVRRKIALLKGITMNDGKQEAER